MIEIFDVFLESVIEELFGVGAKKRKMAALTLDIIESDLNASSCIQN